MIITGLFWRGATRPGAASGMFTGFLASLLWLIFFQVKVAGAMGICQFLFKTPSLNVASPWALVDSIVIAFPLAMIVTVAVSLKW